MTDRALTVQEFDKYGVDQHTTLLYISAMELRAINVARQLDNSAPSLADYARKDSPVGAMRSPAYHQPLGPDAGNRKRKSLTFSNL